MNGLTDNERIKILSDRLQREQEVIRAMQYRLDSRFRFIKSLLWRKPWRSSIRFKDIKGDYWWITLINIWHWLRNAHDCQDPAIGCTCSGGFRCPTI